MFKARINSIFNISPTVKQLSLKLLEEGFQFKPGQWVDFIVPNMKEVAGFSICSSPSLLKTSGIFDLAVKQSDFAPTKWVHQMAQVGNIVEVRVGGKFYYDESNIDDCNILLVGGGVGINPLYSIIQTIVDSKKKHQVKLLHSAASSTELLFRKHIENIIESNPSISVQWFVTKPSEANQEETVSYRRINASDLISSLETLGINQQSIVKCLLCGPPPMVDDLQCILRNHLPVENIYYENWWNPPTY